MPRLMVAELTDDRLVEAYPLVRAASQVPPERWSEYAEALRHRGGGVIAVEDHAGRIYGVAAFRPGDTLRHGKCLIVDTLAAFELGHEGAVKSALCDALQREAKRRNLARLLVHSITSKAGAAEPSPDEWAEIGARQEGTMMTREILLGSECGRS